MCPYKKLLRSNNHLPPNYKSGISGPVAFCSLNKKNSHAEKVGVKVKELVKKVPIVFEL